MNESAVFDGQIAKNCDISIHAVSTAALYGKGVFTTLAIVGGRPFLWEKHWRRITDNTDRLGISLPLSEDRMRADLYSLLELNQIENGRARITVFDSSLSSIWSDSTDQPAHVLIMTGDARTRRSTLRLGISPCRINSTSPLAGIKSCNYLENWLALEEAHTRGFDEAVRVNELGEIASACMANIFWEKDEKLFTSTLDTGCLAGTTREFVMENLPCKECTVSIKELLTADSVFLTSAALGIANVSEIEGKKFRTSQHQISKLIPVPAG